MSPASISLIPCLIVFGLTFASLATAARFQRSLASIARYCLHCFSLRLILICSYCCSFESLSMPPSFADFSLMLQVIIGRALSQWFSPRHTTNRNRVSSLSFLSRGYTFFFFTLL